MNPILPTHPAGEWMDDLSGGSKSSDDKRRPETLNHGEQLSKSGM
jgi:hypothetical protein